MGYGTGSTSYVFAPMGYPHNIFLEVLMTGGLILLIPFLLFIVCYVLSIIYILKKHLHDSALVGFAASSLMFFLQFNTSFSLESGYIPLGTMLLLNLVVHDLKIKGRNEKSTGSKQLCSVTVPTKLLILVMSVV